MVALLHSMDAELPRGSQVTVLNLRPKEEVLGAPAQLPTAPAELTHGPAPSRTRLHVAQHLSTCSCLRLCRCQSLWSKLCQRLRTNRPLFQRTMTESLRQCKHERFVGGLQDWRGRRPIWSGCP